jgi:lactoylglutathione lyase
MPFRHVCYRVLDVDRSIAFYEALGFSEDFRTDTRNGQFSVHMKMPGDEEARVELTYELERTEPYSVGDGFNHIALGVSDLDGLIANLAEKGIEPGAPPYSNRPGGYPRLTFVIDPDGYRIDLVERR